MENNKNISISLFRIYTDSKYLDMIFECPEEYYFTSLQIEVKYIENQDFKSAKFDLSNAIFKDSEGDVITNQHKWTVRLPLEKIGISVPAIYKAEFKASLLSEIIDAGNPNSLPLELPNGYAVCSDVNFAYRCMLDTLLDNDPCNNVSDDLIRNYLLLYGHQSALTTGDDEYAERYFKLISNCFKNCGNTTHCISCRDKKVNNCNCGK